MDGLGKADPYVILLIGDLTFKTKFIDNTETPSWNETFTFPIIKGDEDLEVQLWDKDVSKDDRISMTKIPLSGIRDGQPVDSWFPLKPYPEVAKKGGGTVHLQLIKSGSNQEAFAAGPAAGAGVGGGVGGGGGYAPAGGGKKNTRFDRWVYSTYGTPPPAYFIDRKAFKRQQEQQHKKKPWK